MNCLFWELGGTKTKYYLLNTTLVNPIITEGHYAFKTGISVKHLKISPSPITQSINQNNAKGVSLIHEGALAGVLM